MEALILASLAAFAGALLGVVFGITLSKNSQEKANKQRKTSNVVLVSLGVFALAFIIAMIVVFCVKGSVPDTLIQYTLGAGGIEAAALSAIKITKVKCGSKEEFE